MRVKPLINTKSTEGELHVQHKVEQNPKGPHIHFESINFIEEDFRRHVMFGPQDGASHFIMLLGEPEVCELVMLSDG